MIPRQRLACVLLILTLVLPAARATAQEKIDFTQEKLPNGLDVIYAPMRGTPPGSATRSLTRSACWTSSINDAGGFMRPRKTFICDK